MSKHINLAIIGVGQRGYGHIHDCLVHMEDVNIVGICDLYQDRVSAMADLVAEKKGKRPEILTTDYQEILSSAVVEAVLVSTSWEAHVQISIDAMRAKKAVAMEVGCAYSEYECRELIRAYEETKTPFMFMENCCFDRRETMIFNMVKEGLFGEIVHCEGGYCHDLRSEVAKGKENRHYRLRNYMADCFENYPTHEMGPIARVLDINHGNRMVSLVAIASKSAGIAAYAKEHLDGRELAIVQGDVITTIIKCARGQTITLTHDTALPRPYSRRFTVSGTKARYSEDGDYVFIDGKNSEAEWNQKAIWNNAKDFEAEYLDKRWVEMDSLKIEGAHGGMDYVMWRDFIENLKAGRKMSVDVYDAATWMSVSYLTEASIAAGGSPIYMPDFTDGKWVLEVQI